ncbi:MAG: hypothetical protein NC131_20550 [Roseburia sp.]|nr:hypothetical protein [Roseburia sp.]
MTIQQIITELKKEQKDYEEAMNDYTLEPVVRSFYLGRNASIKTALHWIKYLNKKTEE